MLKRGPVLMLALFTTTLIGTAHAAQSQEFSAEMLTQTGGQQMRAKFYMGNNKVRMEMPEATVISRIDRGVSWILMKEQNMYMEQAIDPKTRVQGMGELPGEVSRQSMGKEDVSGRPSEKFLIRYKGGQGLEDIYQWLGADGIPVKIASIDGQWWMEYQYIQPGAQADDLFEIPEGFQKMVMPKMPNMADMAALAEAEESQ